jgi:hypothetical protein
MKSLDNGETPKRVVRIPDDLWAWADNYADLLAVDRSKLVRGLLENERRRQHLLNSLPVCYERCSPGAPPAVTLNHDN